MDSRSVFHGMPQEGAEVAATCPRMLLQLLMMMLLIRITTMRMVLF